LDGTLIDSKRDLVCAVNAARTHLRMAPLEDETIFSYVGEGAPVQIRRALGPDATEAEGQEALAFFLAYYSEHNIDHTTLYARGRRTLERLVEAGVKLAVLTNKPVRISRGILEALGIGCRFERVYGGNSFDQKKPHPIGVETLLAECGAARERTVMVGD